MNTAVYPCQPQNGAQPVTDWGFLLVRFCQSLVTASPGLTLQLNQIDDDQAIVRQYGEGHERRPPPQQLGLLKICGTEELDFPPELLGNGSAIHWVDNQSPFAECYLEGKPLRAVISLDCRPTHLFMTFYHQQPLESLGLSPAKLQQVRDAANSHLCAEQLVIGLLENLAESMQMPMAIVDAQRRLVYLNREHQQLFGYTLKELLGKPVAALRSYRHNDEFYERMWKKAASGMWSGKVWHKRKNGDFFYSSQTILALRNQGGETTHYGIIQQDPGALPFNGDEQNDQRLDHLTGQLNGQFFLKSSQSKLEAQRENGKFFGLALININNFTEINEHLGTEGGDQLLRDFSNFLSACLGANDLLGRLFGDEFAVFTESEDIRLNMERLAGRIKDGLSKKFRSADQDIYVSASLGIAIYPDDGKTVRTLLNHASDAVKRCERRHQSQHRFYHKPSQQRSVSNNLLKTQLIKAIGNKQIIPHYQPITNIRTGRIEKVEVLARWIKANKQPVSPGTFIPVAQEYGLMPELGNQLFEQVLNHIELANRQLPHRLAFNINKSIPEFEQGKAIDHWLARLRAKNLAPEQLTIEVTEDAAVSSQQVLTDWLMTLRHAGVNIAIDDFGTGYASLSYLVNNPFGSMKIDRTFVANLQEEKSLTLVKSMISLAHELKMVVVAEGIETDGQLRLLKHLKCDYAQGFLLHRPMPFNELMPLCLNQRKH